MITEKNQAKITTIITQIYQKVITRKINQFIAWPWINLVFSFALFINLAITIFSFIVTYDLHFAMKKAVFLPLGISFFLITLINITLIILIKKRQKILINQIKVNFNNELLVDIYNDFFQTPLPGLTITDITTQWTISPTNLPFLSDFKINDNIIVGQYENNYFNLGSVSQTTNTIIDNLQPNLRPTPHNTQYYRYLCFTITSPSAAKQQFEITRKNKYQKNNLTFDNFFWYDQTNKDLPLSLQTLILENMKTTKMIPNIKVSNHKWSFQLTTSSSNNSKDNYHSLLNFNITLKQKRMLKNIFLTINHDYEILQKSFTWLNLITSND